VTREPSERWNSEKNQKRNEIPMVVWGEREAFFKATNQFFCCRERKGTFPNVLRENAGKHAGPKNTTPPSRLT